MNAAIRGVVRTALGRGVEVRGYIHGYDGLIQDESRELHSHDVGGILNRGGTILRTARSKAFRTPEGRAKAVETMQRHGVEGLVVIGGNGSMTGALALIQDQGFPVAGVASTIDNDLACTDYTIGFDTAINTALEAIDRVRDTAYSHDRVFVIEVMGRDNGFIALEAGLAGGAEAILTPEKPYNMALVCSNLKEAIAKGKRSHIIVVAEGAARAADVQDFIQKTLGIEARHMILGHMQRGGSPTAFDRVLAVRLANHATNQLLDGNYGGMAGVDGTRLVYNPLSYVISSTRELDESKLELTQKMAT